MNNSQKASAILSYVSSSYKENEYPALKHQSDIFWKTKPLKDISILDCTPLFKNTLLKYIPLILSDCKLSVNISDQIPHDLNIVKFLESIEISIVKDISDQQFDIILDCDGSRSNLQPTIGVCELTRSGKYYYENKNFPVILVDSSKIKEIETIIGTGDGYIRGMKEFGFNEWKDKHVVIFGYGKVGRGVVNKLSELGATILIVDYKEHVIDCSFPINCYFYDVEFFKENSHKVIESYDHLITATGIKGSMLSYNISDLIMKNRIIISNISIEDEWLDSIPKSRIINNGNAVNFVCSEPTRLRYIDPTMALSNQSAVDLTTRKLQNGINLPLVESERFYLDKVFEGGLIKKELEDFGFVENKHNN